jgi:hypothetical protein
MRAFTATFVDALVRVAIECTVTAIPNGEARGSEPSYTGGVKSEARA